MPESEADLHERAVTLWIFAKRRGIPDDVAAEGVYFTITKNSIPGDSPRPQSVLELCELLNKSQGFPQLSQDAAMRIEALTQHEHIRQQRGTSLINAATAIRRVHQIGYCIGLGVLLWLGFSWWITGAIVAAWWAAGAARMAVQMERAGDLSQAGVFFTICVDILCLIALYVLIVLRLMAVI